MRPVAKRDNIHARSKLPDLAILEFEILIILKMTKIYRMITKKFI